MVMISKKKLRQHLSNESGQAAVEYILLMGVVVVMMVSLTKIMKDRLLPQGGVCVAGSVNFFCQVEAIVSPVSLRYYRVRR